MYFISQSTLQDKYITWDRSAMYQRLAPRLRGAGLPGSSARAPFRTARDGVEIDVSERNALSVPWSLRGNGRPEKFLNHSLPGYHLLAQRLDAQSEPGDLTTPSMLCPSAQNASGLSADC